MEVRNGPGAAILPPNVVRLHLEFAHRMGDGHMGPRKFWQENLPRLKYYNPAVPMIVNRHLVQDGPAVLSIYIRDESAALPAPDVPPPTLPPPTTSSSAKEAAATAGGGGETEVDAESKTSEAEGEGEGESSAAASSTPPATQPPTKAPATTSRNAWAQLSSQTDGSATAPPPARGERVVALNVKLMHSADIWKKVLAATGAAEQAPTAEDQAEMERLERLREQAVKDRAVQKEYRDNIKAEKQMLERARKEAEALKGE